MLKNKIIRDTSSTTIASYLTKFIGLFRGFIVAKLLDPSSYGYFSGLSLIFLYNSQAHLGILHGLNRKLSLSKGAGQLETYDELKNNGITAIVFLSFLFAGIIFAYSFWVDDAYSSELKWGFRFYAVLSVMFHLQYILHSLLRVEHRFKEIAKSNLLFSLSNLVLVLGLAYYFRFYGVLIAFLMSLFLQDYYLYYVNKVNVKFQFNIPVVKELLLIGAPISFAYLIDVILNSIDRLMIAIFLTSKELGFYGIGLTLSSEFLLQLPNSISYVIYPRLLEKFGKYKNYNALLDLFQTSSAVVACVMSIVVGVLFIAVDYLIPYLLPRYVDAIPVAKILIFSSYFISINQIAVRVMITTGKTNKLVQFQVIVILLNVLLNYFMIKNGFGINGVAVATAVSYFVYSICVTHYTLGKFFNRFLSSIKEQVLLYLPLIYVCFLLGMILRFNFSESMITHNFLFDFFSCSFKISLLIILYAPVIFINFKKIKAHLNV